MVTQTPSNPRANLGLALLVCLGATVPYVSTVQGYFLRDDFGVVQYFAGRSFAELPRLFAASWMDGRWGFTLDEIRPLPAVSFQVATLWGAGSPVAHHVINIGVHAANALLVMAVARHVAALGFGGALFAAIVFAVLPVQAETVAWINGRVDSLPTLFYVAAFLAYWRWRATGATSRTLYLGSILLFAAALFSKQSTVTMVATLVSCDALLFRRWPTLSWSWLRPYTPFLALTVAYLALRLLLFGDAVRESQLTAYGLKYFAVLLVRHSKRLVCGNLEAAPAFALVASVVTSGTLAIAALGERLGAPPRAGAVVTFFGPVWVGIGVLPLVVAGYESARHLYLATVGWAVLLGIAVNALWHVRSTGWWRGALITTGAAVVTVYLGQLSTEVDSWNAAATVSRRAVTDLQREATRVPEGSLLVVGAPVECWDWAVPFVAQPPFADGDLSRRVFLVSPWRLHSRRVRWAEDTRQTIRAWAGRTPPGRIVVLRWNPRSAALGRLSDDEDPRLRTDVLRLLGIAAAHQMDEEVRVIVERAPSVQ